MNEVATIDRATLMETVMVKGDLSKLSAIERNQYYMATCESLGLNPLTKPFDYLVLSNRMVMYAKRDCADQLRKLHGVDIEIVDKKIENGLFMVTARAKDRAGRVDEDMGVVSMPQGSPEIRANAMLKAITKAKRRVTLSICGLGFMDETEAEDLERAERPSRQRRKSVEVRTVTSADTPETIAEQDSPRASSPAADEGAPSQTAPESGAPTSQMSVEELAREAARRGRSVLRGFLSARTAAERARLKPIYAELEGLIPQETSDAAAS